MRRMLALVGALAVVTAGLLLGSAAAQAAVPSMPGVAASLQRSPVYIDPHADPPTVDAQVVLKALPPQTYFADLPRSALSADGDPATVPALLSSQVGRGGTFVVLMGGRFFGASTTMPGKLGDEIASAQSLLPARGDATGVVAALMRSLAGSGDAQDASGPRRAGGPVGRAALIAILIGLVVGGLALWWWLRRRPRAGRRPPREAPPRDLVEVDYYGHIVRRVPADERGAGSTAGPDGPDGMDAAHTR